MSEDLVTIARYYYPFQAEILAAKLQAEGIQSYIRGIDNVLSDAFMANAIGGIRVEVLASDEAYARHVLNNLEAEPVDMETEGRVIEINRTRYDEVPGKCIHCNSASVFVAREKQNLDEYEEVVSKTLHVPIPLGNNYFCLSCNQSWKV